MANRKRKGGSGSSGGTKGFAISAVLLLLVGAAIYGWWTYNGFKSIGDAFDWMKNKSSEVQLCVEGDLSKDANDAQKVFDAHNCLWEKIFEKGDGSVKPGTGTTPTTPSVAPSNPSVAPSELLNGITVAPSEKVAYKRSEWKHWVDLNGDGCDARQEALKSSGTDVKVDGSCKVLSGTWLEPYASLTFTNPSLMDLDHIVPLSYAASNGGQKMTKDLKQAFANDPLNLALADASENRSKGDEGPSEYLPPNENFQCEYATRFVEVVKKYDLTMPQADYDKAAFILKAKCQ